MYERFNEQARQVIVSANDEARLLKHNYIGTEHILLALLRTPGIAREVLWKFDFERASVAGEIERRIGRGEEALTGQIPFTPRTKKVLELSLREALSLGHNHIGTEHILLALAREGEGVAMQVIAARGVDQKEIRDEVIRHLMSRPEVKHTINWTPAMEKSCETFLETMECAVDLLGGDGKIPLLELRRALDEISVSAEAFRETIDKAVLPPRTTAVAPTISGESHVGRTIAFGGERVEEKEEDDGPAA